MCLLDGNDVDSHDCLFIDPHLSGRDQFLTELSQPVWEEQSTGKVRLIKASDGAPSPNFFAAACLVFAGETRSMGLEARVVVSRCDRTLRDLTASLFSSSPQRGTIRWLYRIGE